MGPEADGLGATVTTGHAGIWLGQSAGTTNEHGVSGTGYTFEYNCDSMNGDLISELCAALRRLPDGVSGLTGASGGLQSTKHSTKPGYSTASPRPHYQMTALSRFDGRGSGSGEARDSRRRCWRFGERGDAGGEQAPHLTLFA